jgi:hypothetical protein
MYFSRQLFLKTMILRIAFLALFFSERVLSFAVVNNNGSKFSTSLGYADSEILADAAKHDSFRNSIVKSYQREEPEPTVSSSQLLTEQLGREFTTARRYLLAAVAVKELSEEFFAAEEQQRVRAIELIEYARTNGIKLFDYASQVDSSPIDKSLPPAEFLKELLLQEQQDVKLLNQVMIQASSSNQNLVDFLQSVQTDQLDRQHHLIQTLAHSMPSLDIHTSMSALDTATTANLIQKVDLKDSIQPIARWYENQLLGLGRNMEVILSRAGHATAVTAAAVDSVDSESLPSTEDFIQAMDSATTLLEEPSLFVDSIQQNIMDTETLSQIIDIVAGLY